MALPAEASGVTVTETYIDGAGTVQTGTVTFTPSTRVFVAGSSITLDPVVAQVVAGVLKAADGTSALVLAATDDVDLSPSGWTWRVEERVGSKVRPARYVQLPASPSPRVLHSLSDVEPVEPVAARVLTVNGTSPDAAGNIEVTVGASAVTSVAGRVGAVVLTKSDVGLGNVDNTSDANKPLSSATVTALAGKETGGAAAAAIAVHEAASNPHPLYAPLASPTFTGTVAGVTKTHVGLGSVDNTSDANKPVSTATQTALDAKASKGKFASTIKTDGNIQLSTGTNTWGLLTGSPTVAVNAAAGDLICFSLQALRQANANIYLDCCVAVSGAPARYMGTMSSTPAGEGSPVLYHTNLPAAGGSWSWVAQAGDISGGQVTVSFAIRNTTGASSLLLASTDNPMIFMLENRGPVN